MIKAILGMATCAIFALALMSALAIRYQDSVAAAVKPAAVLRSHASDDDAGQRRRWRERQMRTELVTSP
jgi:hypothetical protein